MLLSLSNAAVISAVLLVAGCSRSELPVPPALVDLGAVATGSGGHAPVDAGVDAPAPNDAAVPEIVYVATGASLYELNLDALALSAIGPFSGCDGAILDIAVDRENHMFATTTMGFATVESSTGTCSMVAFGAYPNSLVTVPKGTVDPSDEALVGFVDATYVRIDKLSGVVTTIGDLAGGDLISSGDIAVLPDGRAFLSVKQGECFDCLVEVDPKTGSMLNLLGPIGFGMVYGLASSKGMGVGFNSGGEAFTIDLSTGIGSLIGIDGAPPNIHYNGAASLPAKDAL